MSTGTARRRWRRGCPSSTGCSRASRRLRGSTSSSTSSRATREAEVEAAAAALGHALAGPLRAEGARGYGAGAMTSAEALAYVVLETSDEPLFVTNVDLTEARIGGLGTDVARRFLEVLAENAGLVLHVRLLERHRQRSRARGDLQGARRRAGRGVREAGGTSVSDKTVVRTEAAPAPFQGAPYSQAIAAGGFVFVSGQLGLKPGDTAISGGDRGADRAGLREPEGDPRGGGHRARPAREDDRLPPEPRRLPGDERGLRAARRRAAAGAGDRRGGEAPVRRARRDRGDRTRVTRHGAAP